MATRFADYKTLDRAGKASRINAFHRDNERAAKTAFPDDVHRQGAMETTAWLLLIHSLALSAAEIAEAILLCEIHFPWWDDDGSGPYGGDAATNGADNALIDRAMYMASEWSVDGYEDCFTMHEFGWTKFGSLERIRAVAQAGGLERKFVADVEAGAIAAKAACDVANFFVMTAGYEPSSAAAAGTAHA